MYRAAVHRQGVGVSFAAEFTTFYKFAEMIEPRAPDEPGNTATDSSADRSSYEKLSIADRDSPS
jgi:hypothetical protein